LLDFFTILGYTGLHIVARFLLHIKLTSNEQMLPYSNNPNLLSADHRKTSLFRFIPRKRTPPAGGNLRVITHGIAHGGDHLPVRSGFAHRVDGLAYSLMEA